MDLHLPQSHRQPHSTMEPLQRTGAEQPVSGTDSQVARRRKLPEASVQIPAISAQSRYWPASAVLFLAAGARSPAFPESGPREFAGTLRSRRLPLSFRQNLRPCSAPLYPITAWTDHSLGLTAKASASI